MSVSVGSFSDARRNFLDVCIVPEVEVNQGDLNVGFGGVDCHGVT